VARRGAERPAGPTVRIRLDLSYVGTGFRGFAVQAGVKTVGGELIKALERALRHRVELTCAGRTDAGVHARQQVVSFDAAEGLDLEALIRSVNKQLAPAIAVQAASITPADWDARRSATGRRYRYAVLNRLRPDPFWATTAWHVPDPLDLRAMQLACDPIIGTHDFSSFCRRPPVAAGEPQPSLVRLAWSAEWLDSGQGVLCFEIEASSFCHQMVRSLVGTMVEIGMGKRKAGEMSAVLAACDRARAGQLAPPHGLCLLEVRY
jgi:tRNA pseudouridine38-40 synthase